LTPTALEASTSDRRAASPHRSLYAKLKPGPGRSEEEVLDSQRSRLRRAMIDLSADRGYEAVTVRALTRLAGVSTRSFYSHFGNVEECFTFAYQSLAGASLRKAEAARNGSVEPEEAVRAAVESLFEDVARDPKAAWLVLVEAYAAGPAMQLRIEEAITSSERLLCDSLAAAGPPMPSTYLLAGIAAAVARVARWRLHVGEGAKLPKLAGELTEWIFSLVERCASLEASDSDSLGLVAGPNGNHRESAGLTIPGELGEDRGRILSATVKLAASGGFESLRIPRIRREAGVSRRSFDARYTGVSECFLEAIEAVATTAVLRAGNESRGVDSWERGILRGTRALCEDAASNPALARLVFVEITAPGREGLGRRERLLTLAAEALRAGATACGHRASALVAEASSAAAWRIARVEVGAGRTRNLRLVLPLIAYMILAPTIDPSAAAELIESEELRPVY
jgi:AcrR family transcriptional regulator